MKRFKLLLLFLLLNAGILTAKTIHVATPGTLPNYISDAEKYDIEELPVVDGFSADQRFFLAYAGIWAQNITDQEIRNRTMSDPHSLGRWRVNGALPHIDAWYSAFGVKEGDRMFIPKEKRLSLW